MSKAREKDGWLAISCPACCEVHEVPVNRVNQTPREWFWNGDLEKVTLVPSLNAKLSQGRTCHFNIVSGRIQFHADCTHSMKSTTVDLPVIT